MFAHAHDSKRLFTIGSPPLHARSRGSRNDYADCKYHIHQQMSSAIYVERKKNVTSSPTQRFPFVYSSYGGNRISFSCTARVIWLAPARSPRRCGLIGVIQHDSTPYRVHDERNGGRADGQRGGQTSIPTSMHVPTRILLCSSAETCQVLSTSLVCLIVVLIYMYRRFCKRK